MASGKLRRWLVANRTTVRLAFVLRLFSMAVGSLTSLLWTRVLLRAMGDGAYGLMAAFQPVSTLGGLGDLGITGALAIRSGQAVARREEEKLRVFLAGSRSLVLLFGLFLAGLFLSLSPWMPHWLGFKPAPGSGSLTLLFATGSVTLLVIIGAGYVNALNGGYGTVTWPIIPTLLLSQLGLAAQWGAASLGAPLWVQSLALTIFAAMGVLAGWAMLKASHPWLGELRPVTFDLRVWRDLATTSGWAYLYNLGNAIYATTDRLLINGGFGAALVPRYLLNAKLCELALQIIRTGCAVSLPKINQWLASPMPADREKGIEEIRRLNIFQTLLACVAAMLFVSLNDSFMHWWLGSGYVAPWAWQIAFALNLTVTASGDAAVQIAGVCGKSGLRFAGTTIGLTGLLNLGLSVVSMKCGSIAGIAFATVLAQSLLVLILGWKVCRYLEVTFHTWVLKSWLFPVIAVGVACGLRSVFPPVGAMHIAILLASDGLLLGLLARAVGFKRSLVEYELRTIRAMLRGR